MRAGRPGQTAISLAPQEQVLIVSIEPIEIRVLARAFAHLAEGHFSAPPDFEQQPRNLAGASDENRELRIARELATRRQSSHLLRK